MAFLLRLTVLAPPGTVRLFAGPESREWRVALGGWQGPDDPLPLTDGRYLRLSMTLYREETHEGPRLKVEKSSLQYQTDPAGEHWVFRYDYLRHPPEPHPAAHLQVRGTLAEEFRVPCHEPPDVWRPVLAASEQEFLAIAHTPRPAS